MFSNAFIALIIGIGLGVWVYSKAMKQTGNNTKNSVIVAVICGGVVFLIVITLIGMFIK